MTENIPFLRWFVPWKGARPEILPIGYYSLADLEAAFDAGMDAKEQQAIARLRHDLRQEQEQQALEELRHRLHGKD